MVATTAGAAAGGQWLRLVVRGQQGFQALAQGGVAVAGGVQERRALVGRLFQRGSKQHFFPILRRWHV